MPVTTENPDHVEFGAVYFRKTNPPREDWARDYAVAREDGHTIFRHWVPWAALEIAPNEFDWADYDRQLDLAAKNGIKTVLAEIGQDVPEWLYHRYPHARREQYDGKQRRSEMHVSCVVGGNHSMCLDNPEIADAMSRFLRALARRYKDHPGLYAYDVWNECTYYRPELVCYCNATQKKFRLWLQKKYGSLEKLAVAWKRYSFTSWDEVQLPRQPKHYPDVMDAIAFQTDNAYEWLKWRVSEIRCEDPNHFISAHGNAKTHCDAAPSCGDDWRAGELVDIFGYTFFYGNDCDPAFAGDMIRSAARGREYWRAEAVGDSDWLDRRRGDKTAIKQDVMHDPQNIRLDCLISLLTGAGVHESPMAATVGWTALRRLRLVRHGWGSNRSIRHDPGSGGLGQHRKEPRSWRSRSVRATSLCSSWMKRRPIATPYTDRRTSTRSLSRGHTPPFRPSTCRPILSR